MGLEGGEGQTRGLVRRAAVGRARSSGRRMAPRRVGGPQWVVSLPVLGPRGAGACGGCGGAASRVLVQRCDVGCSGCWYGRVAFCAHVWACCIEGPRTALGGAGLAVLDLLHVWVAMTWPLVPDRQRGALWCSDGASAARRGALLMLLHL